MKALLSGNEAIARGAYEAGVQIVTGYPGTPSSEIVKNMASQYGNEVYVEWSTNEKVAMDAAAGAAYCGKRALVTTKQVGMNVLMDSLLYTVYTGAEAGLVLVTADDPGLFSSQNEQDNRWYSRLAKIPTFEPCDSQEAKDFVKKAFELSEKFDIPCLLHSVMRVSHCKSVVELGPRDENTKVVERFPRNLPKYNCTAMYARVMHAKMEEKIKAIVAAHKFVPNSNARQLKVQQNRSIIIVVKGAFNMFFAAILERMQSLISCSGYSAEVHYLDEDADEVLVGEQLQRERKPLGFIFLGGNTCSFEARFSAIAVPSVLATTLADHLNFGNLSSVGIDDTAAQVRALRRRGIRVAAVFLGENASVPAANAIYGRDLARIRRMDELAQAAGRLIQDEIRELSG